MSAAKSPSPTSYGDSFQNEHAGEPDANRLAAAENEQEEQALSTGIAQEDDKHTNLWLRSIFFLLGVGILTPWNAFISAKAYFESRLCDSGEGGDNIESTFAVVYNCSSVFSLGLVILAQWFSDQRNAAEHESLSSGGGSSNSNNNNNALNANDSPGRRQSNAGSSSSSSSNSSASGHSFWLVMVPLFLYFLVFLSQAAVVLWTDLEPSAFFVYTISGLALCGICGAIASAGITATAGLFLPEIAMEPFMAGQSAGGLGVALVNFIAATTEDPQDFWDAHCSRHESEQILRKDGNGRFLGDISGLMDYSSSRKLSNCTPYSSADHAVLFYFLLGSLVLVACLSGYVYIDNFQKVQHRDEYETIHDNDPQGGGGAIGDTSSVDMGSIQQSPAGVELNNALLQQRGADDEEQDQHVALSSSMDQVDFRTNGSPTHQQHQSPHRGMVDTHMSFGHDAVLDSHHENENETSEVLGIVKGPAFSIFLVFVVTLSLFPGWVSQLRSVRQCNSIHNRLANDLYTPFAFVWFNLFDFLGRIMSAYLPLSRIHHVSAKLVAAAFLRFATFPLLFICASHHDGAKWIFHSDIFSITVQAFFAVSNGLVVTTAFVHAPSLLPNVTHVQERSAEILTFALYVGLLTGSLLSVPVSNSFAG